VRKFLVLLILLVPMTLVCWGCGKARPDPREQEGFVDDTNPDVTAQQMDDINQSAQDKSGQDKSTP